MSEQAERSAPRPRRMMQRASSIGVDARVTPLDAPGKPATAQCDGLFPRPPPGCGTIAFLKSGRPAEPRAGERNGDRAVARAGQRPSAPLCAERRLVYVAATRATDTLILTQVRTRAGRDTAGPSRFLYEA